MIALVVTGIVMTAFLSLLRAQDRFYSRLDEGVAAQQNLRAAADLVSSEVRMSGPGDVMAAVPDSVSVRFDVYHAVVCAVTGSNTVALFVYDSAPNPNVTTGLVGTAWSGPYQSTYEYADGWTGSSATSAAAKTECVNNGTPDVTPSALYRSMSGWTGTFTAVPPRGSIVRRYRRLTYRFAPSGMSGGFALYRGTQELVGPLDPRSAFSYVMADGSVRNTVSPSDLDNIRVVRLNAIAVDDDPRFDLQRNLIFDIPLRD